MPGKMVQFMSGSLDILTFHRILPPGERYFLPPMAIDAKTFSGLIERLAAAGRLVPLEEGVHDLKCGTLAGRKVAITFDDGYLDNFSLARDLLLRAGAPATFFVPIAPIDDQRPYWWDYLRDVVGRETKDFFAWLGERFPNGPLARLSTAGAMDEGDSLDEMCRSLVQVLNSVSESLRRSFMDKLNQKFGPFRGKQLLMTWQDIRQLSDDGFAIGSHSCSHIPLTDLPPEIARREIVDSATLLEERLGRPASGFCYPRGSCNGEHIDMVADSGYPFAVTTQFGSNSQDSNRFALGRRNIADYRGLRARFPVAMHLFELSGCLDRLLATRRSA